jgi:NAD(P)-dependent dehydrogenase (short-subunit alcohol dehydrogenase family)
MKNADNFNGKTILITGASSGLGFASAQQFARAGGRVVGVDRNEERLRAAIASWPAATGGAHEAIVADLQPADAPKLVMAEAARRVGVLDVLVNSAGVCHFNHPAKISVAEWDEVMEIDLRALYFMGTLFAEQVDPQRGGRLINIGSNAGRKGRAMSAHYAAAKAGVASVSESLALAYGAKNVTVNTVCPAVVVTPLWETSFSELNTLTGKSSAELTENWKKLTPLGRLGTPEDVANLITFLASDRGSFITGQTINVCGGFMLTC